ncbi:MAG: ADP-ribosylglycohydrolase [Rhodobacteraceae bacterium]|nr:ADP-ribosylglycohydrolase [Paracoccaceae bacterium]
MSDLPDHFCPGCGAAQKVFPRYPWYFCKDCVKRATDGAGRALKFANTSAGGGFAFAYAAADDWVCCGHVLCRIQRRPVLVGEARFGGIVAQPVPDRPLESSPNDTINLKGKERYVPDDTKRRPI